MSTPSAQALIDAFAVLKASVVKWLQGLNAKLPADYQLSPDAIQQEADTLLAGLSLGTIDAVRTGIKDLLVAGHGEVGPPDPTFFV